ncbi:hypothetical protein EYR38_006910 [Pleurotus pulmonarius]|nr:hypothetical protein EYR38_006910 [Pleurotus pulmonarius]
MNDFKHMKLVSPTGRLVLAAPQVEDDPAVSVLRSDPAVLRYLTGVIPDVCTIEDARQLRETRSQDTQTCDFYIHLIENESPKFVGMTGIFKISDAHRSCEVGILVSPQVHGQGIATEALYMVLNFAFAERGMHRVTAQTSAANQPMRKWFEEVAGATVDGHMRDAWSTAPGKYVDTIVYGILEDEWREVIKPRLEVRMTKEKGSG